MEYYHHLSLKWTSFTYDMWNHLKSSDRMLRIACMIVSRFVLSR